MSKHDKEKMLENLKDAGFDKAEIQEFFELYKSGTLNSQCDCLQKKRKKLLEKVHKNEQCIDCLDYLKYLLENEESEEKDE